MRPDFLRCTLVAILLTGTLAHGQAPLIEGAGQPDLYESLRRNCATAGEDEFKRCQGTALRAGKTSRNLCNEALERERRMCMLQVMLRQNRDIQGPLEPSPQ